MSGKTHAAVAAAVAVWTGEAAVTLGGSVAVLPAWLLSVVVGGLLPDIDEPESVIGRRWWWLAWPLNRVVGHRTLSHSVLGIALAGLLAGGLAWAGRGPLTSMAVAIGAGLMIGMAVHVGLDLLTGSAQVWWPSPNRVSLARWAVCGWQDRLLGVGASLATIVGGWHLLARMGAELRTAVGV